MIKWSNIGKKILKDVACWFKENKIAFFPIRKDLQGYNKQKGINDLLAGANVALLSFPQGIAYAVIAGLPIQYGIYASAIAALMGSLFAGSRFIVFGPTNTTAVLLFTSFLNMGISDTEKIALLPLLLFMVGIFLVTGALLKVTSLIPFISRTVIIGYITAAAFFIIANQIRKLLGIEFFIPSGTTFFGVIRLTFAHLSEVDMSSLLVSIATFFIYFFFQKKFKKIPNVAITLILISGMVLGTRLWFDWGGNLQMLTVVSIENWEIIWPQFNESKISKLVGLAMILAFIGMVESSFIAKSLAARAGEKIDSSQQVFGLGAANLGCSLTGGMCVSGSITRSQLNWDSGAATSLSVFLSGLFCLAGIFLFGHLIQYIPQAALGALIILIGMSVINIHVIRVVLRTTGSDATVFIITFLSALFFRLDIAIIAGTVISIFFFLKKVARPELVHYHFNNEGALTEFSENKQLDSPQVSIIHVEGELFFGAAELFRDQMRRVCEDPNLRFIILKVRNAHHLDATAVLALEELIHYMEKHNCILLISEARKSFIRVLHNSGLIKKIKREHIFIDYSKNPNLSTAHALQLVKKMLKDQEGNISILTSKTPTQ